MALLTVGANAQTIVFDDYADKTAEGAADDLTIESGDIKVELDGGSKCKIAQKSLTFALATATTDAERETFGYQYCPGGAIAKTSGERSITITLAKAGTLTIYPRSANASATDRTMSVQQGGTNLLDAVTVSDADMVTIGEKNYYKAYAVEVAAGKVNILTNNTINFSAFKFVASADQGGDEPGGEQGETTAIASWNQGVTTGSATFSAVGTAVLNYSGKIHSNKDGVTAMSFPNSAWAKATTEATENTFINYVKIEGEFKSGDIITIQPFTNMSTTEFTGGSKYGNIVLYDEAGTEINNMTGSAAGALTVTDGHEEDADPKEFSYTLTSDYTTLCIGRYGNTRISVIKVEISRPTSTAIETVKVAKINDGVIYNLAGQKVGADYKGIAIMNGKKVVLK